MIRRRSQLQRIGSALRSMPTPALWLHPLRMLHYYGYTHVLQRPKLTLGRGVMLAPNTSFANAERIEIGDRVQIGARGSIWAGKTSSWVRIGARTTFGPDCFITAADYGLKAGMPILDQPMTERDVIIGPDCWIGTKSVITAGVTLGEGCVIGAGPVVTRDIPAGAIAAGIPARVLRMRE